MNTLISRLPEPFGIRPLTEKDFFALCEQQGIDVVWHNGVRAFYVSTDLGSFITLPKRLGGLDLLFAAFHELGHHFANVGRPVAVEWFEMHDGKHEAEADAIALIAICPASWLHRLNEILDIYPRRTARKIYRERLRLHFLWGV